MRKKLLAGLLAIFVVASGFAPIAAAAGGGLNYDDGEAPNPYYSADTTISEYRVSDGGDLVYQNDNSEWTELEGELNRSTDVDDLGTGHVNVWSFYATDIDDSALGEFPRNDDESENEVSALDASEWSTTGASVSDVNTAPGVDAVEFSASASGDQATYNNWSSGGAFVTTDAEKRFLQLAYDVNDASGASEVTVTVHDATDGDTVVVKAYDADGQTSSDDVGANSTGDGKVLQKQLGTLTASGGDGNLDEVGKIVVSADGAANVDFAGIDAESTSKWNFGTEWVETDDDDEFEKETVYEATGEITIYDVASMGSGFDDAEIHDVTIPTHVPAELQADADISADFGDAESFPSFDSVLDVRYRMELPNQFDLSYSNTELRLDQSWDESRFATAEYAEAVGESTDLEDVEDDEFTSFSGSLASEGNEVVVDETVGAGDDNVVHFELKLTGDEASAMQATGGGGGAGIFGGGSGGGIIGFFTSLPGMIIGGIGTLFGISRLRG
jgi:hypothetical protein